MVSSIDIKETIEDKKSWFNIKRYQIKGISFEKPEKSLDIRNQNIDQMHFQDYKNAFKFYEGSKYIRKYSDLLTADNDDSRIVDNFFFKKSWLANAPTVINFTFGFNPFLAVKKIDDMGWFFDTYYPYPHLFLTVPNVKLKKAIKGGKLIEIISFEDYIRYVDTAYKNLDDKNNKQIFVPIPMRHLGVRKLADLVRHYLKTERYNYWFDFDGQSINDRAIGKVRHIFDVIKEEENFGNVITYFTNIKREILSNSNESTSVASDALSAIAGANLIGVNREPQKYIPKPPNSEAGKEIIRVPQEVDQSHKARIFNRETYYYVKTIDRDLFSSRKYVPVNAAKLNAEFCTQSEFFLENHNVDILLNTKKMFKDEKAGNILGKLTSKQPDKPEGNLTDFMG
jgi:hypothetical protein